MTTEGAVRTAPGHYPLVVFIRSHEFPEFCADTVDAVRFYSEQDPLIVMTVDRNERIEKAMRPAYPNVLYYTSQSNCFAGETEVSLLDGTERSLESMVGERHWFYGCDEGRVVPNPGRVVRTGRGRKLLEVELDNGEKLRVTPDHEWMLRDGSYLRTDQLRPGESLMPLYRRLSNDVRGKCRRVGYEQFLDPVSETWDYTHHRVAESLESALNFRGGELLPAVKTKYHRTVHHRDFDKRNNTPENLVWMKCGRSCKGAGALARHTKACTPTNHKVVAVRVVEGRHDVYCIETEHPCHNFALSAGVFVHNCGWGGGLFRLFCEAVKWLCNEKRISFDVLWNIDYDLIPIAPKWDTFFTRRFQGNPRIGQLGRYNPNSGYWKRRMRMQLNRLKKTFADHGKQWPRNYTTGDHVAGACGVFKGQCIAQMLSMGLLDRPFSDLGAQLSLADDPMLSLMVSAAGYEFREMGEKAYIKWRMEEDYRTIPSRGYMIYHPTKLVPGNGPYSAQNELQCRNFFRRLRGQGEIKLLKDSPSTGRPNSILC